MNDTGYKKALLTALAAMFVGHLVAQEPTATYVPALENLEARQEFADSKLGIFIHWGIYSMFAQGEWYMTNANIDNKEYAKAASAFYPINFDAKAWVSAIKTTVLYQGRSRLALQSAQRNRYCRTKPLPLDEA